MDELLLVVPVLFYPVFTHVLFENLLLGLSLPSDPHLFVAAHREAVIESLKANTPLASILHQLHVLTSSDLRLLQTVNTVSQTDPMGDIV